MHFVRCDRRKSFRIEPHSVWCCALGAMILALCAVPVQAQCTEQKLTASDAVSAQWFGRAVSVNGEVAVVGAWGDECEDGYACGAAYVYRLDGTSWVEEQKLIALDASENDRIGDSVSVSGDTVLVGVSSESPRRAVYVFRFDGTAWIQQQKLTSPQQDWQDHFGQSVSVSGDTAVIGANFDGTPEDPRRGAAYVFRFDGTTWVEEQKLTASDAGDDDEFGFSVSVSGNRVLVGALKADCAAGFKCGAAYVFRFNGSSWVEEGKLTGSDSATFHHFGDTISLSEDAAIIGAHNASGGGAAYVFRFNGNSWVEEQKIGVPPSSGGEFPSSASISGDTIVLGAMFAGAGTVFVYRFDGFTWVQELRLIASEPIHEFGYIQQLGYSVSVSGNAVFAGVEYDGCAAGSDCGSAFAFTCAFPKVVNLDIKPGSCPNRVNPRSQGLVRVAVVGSLDFDVAIVDAGSLTLARADGVGGSVSPVSGPSRRRGTRIVIEDMATPLVGGLCSCHALGGDGIDDLSLKFSMSDMTREFQLNAPRGRGSIKLVLRGSLQDGTTFEGFDCIVIPRRGRFFRR